MARGNYGINIGQGRAEQNAVYNTLTRRGITHMRQQWAATMADIRDGTSNTIGIGELVTWHAVQDGTWGVWAYPSAASVSGRNDNTATGILLPNGDANNDNMKDWTPHCPNGLVDPVFRCEDSDTAHAVRSRHTGGVNIGLMDGSVRFVSNSVNGNTWVALFSSAGGEVLGDY
jgi:prepilin-type processing-associated H-X9-DG protein